MQKFAKAGEYRVNIVASFETLESASFTRAQETGVACDERSEAAPFSSRAVVEHNKEESS